MDIQKDVVEQQIEEEGKIIDLDESLQNPDEITIDDDEEDDDPQLIQNDDDDVSVVQEQSILFKIEFPSKENFASYKDVLKSSILGCVDAQIIEDEEKYELVARESEQLSFQIDTTPVCDKIRIPSYKRSIKEVYDGNDPEPVKENDAPARPQNSCFNCSSTDHFLNDCPEKRNNMKIRKAMNNKMNRNHKLTRYHVDNNQRYAHLQPGKISDGLRQALGIQKKELPSFIFRMRVCGYPEAWLKTAEISDSGLSMIDGDREDSTNTAGDRIKYDSSKILSFPGFNEDPGKKFYDDYRIYNVPKWNPSFSRDAFIQSMGDAAVSGTDKPKRMKIHFPNTEEKGEKDMDISSDHEEAEEVEDNLSNKTAEDSEQQLEETTVETTPEVKKDIISTVVGTPILKFSPYDSLPPGSNFQQGVVGDVINFENLPDSTGKYEQMAKIINKVRLFNSEQQS